MLLSVAVVYCELNQSYLLYPRPEGRDEHPWAQGIMDVQSSKYTQDHLGQIV